MGAFRSSQHAIARAWERLGLGHAEAQERIRDAVEVPAPVLAMYNAQRKRYGSRVDPNVTLRFGDGIVWVCNGHQVVTVFRPEHPGFATLLHRTISR
jgi:hypothetical protein